MPEAPRERSERPLSITAEELHAKIRDYLAAKKTGDIVLHVNQGTVTSYDFKESGRVTSNAPPHTYATALRLT